jgi:hypothetical protein
MASCCEYGDEPAGSCTTELVISSDRDLFKVIPGTCLERLRKTMKP